MAEKKNMTHGIYPVSHDSLSFLFLIFVVVPVEVGTMGESAPISLQTLDELKYLYVNFYNSREFEFSRKS